MKDVVRGWVSEAASYWGAIWHGWRMDAVFGALYRRRWELLVRLFKLGRSLRHARRPFTSSNIAPVPLPAKQISVTVSSVQKLHAQ